MIATQVKPAVRRPASRFWSFDEMLAELPETNQPTELWDGRRILLLAPSISHEQVLGRFHGALIAHVRPRRLGTKCGAPLNMVLTNTRDTQPDGVFILSAGQTAKSLPLKRFRVKVSDVLAES